MVLASASPRRRELLAALDLRFQVRPVDLDETPRPGEAPHDYVLRLAQEKAAARAAPGELVLGADTIVVLDGELLGKPSGPAEARQMLARIAGREHTVLTGVALHQPPVPPGSDATDPGLGVERRAAEVASSRVQMAPLSTQQIAWYVATGEPLDKAGSYAVQGLGALFVESIQGNYSNVVGLPLPLTGRLFGQMGYTLLDFRV